MNDTETNNSNPSQNPNPSKDKGGRPRNPAKGSIEETRHLLSIELAKPTPNPTRARGLSRLLDSQERDQDRADAIAKDEQRIALERARIDITLLQGEAELLKKRNAELSAQLAQTAAERTPTEEVLVLRDRVSSVEAENNRLSQALNMMERKNSELQVETLKLSEKLATVEQQREKAYDESESMIQQEITKFDIMPPNSLNNRATDDLRKQLNQLRRHHGRPVNEPAVPLNAAQTENLREQERASAEWYKSWNQQFEW